MMPRRMLRLTAFAGAMACAGCALVGPDYVRPDTSLPDRFGTAAPSTPSVPEQALRADWWTLYGDAALNRLVERVLDHNADLRLAVAQLEESMATMREAHATLWPQVDVSGSAARQRISSGTATPIPPTVPLTRSEWRGVLSTSFELDFWGRLRRAREAVREQLLATQYARDVTALSLASTTVQAYLTVRSLDAQAGALRRTLRNREETLALARTRAKAGLVSDLDVQQAELARADASAQLVELQRQRAVTEHQLGALSGQPGLRIPEGELSSLPLPPVPAPGLPATLLDRRPDIRSAEQTLASANARIGVARAAMFPTISLTGSAGGQSKDLENLLSVPSRIGSLGLGLVGPIFDAGRVAARTEQAQARQQQALAVYQRTIEAAFREVADALSNVERSAAAEQALAQRAEAARNTLRLAQLRYEAGYSSYLEVLDAQRTQNDADLAMVRGRQARLAYSVDLMKSLGGGWSPSAPVSLKGERSPSSSR